MHNVLSVLENVTESKLLYLIKKTNEKQQLKNKEFESCIVNLQIWKLITSVGCWIRHSATHDINYFKFKALSGKYKFIMVKSNGLCVRCSRGYPPAHHCKVGELCDAIEGQGPCNRKHHPFLHTERMNAALNANSKKFFRTEY